MDGTIDAGQDNAIAVYGDFSNYVITQRVGSSVELIPHLFGANRRFPQGIVEITGLTAPTF
jgi:predicted phage gp36 major capsid-like protein